MYAVIEHSGHEILQVAIFAGNESGRDRALTHFRKLVAEYVDTSHDEANPDFNAEAARQFAERYDYGKNECYWRRRITYHSGDEYGAGDVEAYSITLVEDADEPTRLQRYGNLAP